MVNHSTVSSQKYSQNYYITGIAFRRTARGTYAPGPYAIVPASMPAEFKTLLEAGKWLRRNPIIKVVA